MGVKNAARIERDLVTAGHNPNLTVDIASAVGMPAEQHMTTSIANLSATISAHRIQNPAVIFISRPIANQAEKESPITNPAMSAVA